MAFVILLKGVNIGGHKTFRPSVLAKELKNANVLSVGAAGTFVVRSAASRTKIRDKILRRLPFKTDVMIFGAREALQLLESNPFGDKAAGPGIVRFISVLARRRKPPVPLPFSFPSRGRWFVRVLSRQGRFVMGMYRREMKSIRYLGQLEKTIGRPITTRNWNTFLSIEKILKS